MYEYVVYQGWYEIMEPGNFLCQYSYNNMIHAQVTQSFLHTSVHK